MTLDPSDLRLRIDEAFGEMPYPGDEHIVPHNAHCWECEAGDVQQRGIAADPDQPAPGALPVEKR